MTTNLPTTNQVKTLVVEKINDEQFLLHRDSASGGNVPMRETYIFKSQETLLSGIVAQFECTWKEYVPRKPKPLRIQTMPTNNTTETLAKYNEYVVWAKENKLVRTLTYDEYLAYPTPEQEAAHAHAIEAASRLTEIFTKQDGWAVTHKKKDKKDDTA